MATKVMKAMHTVVDIWHTMARDPEPYVSWTIACVAWWAVGMLVLLGWHGGGH